MPFYLYFARKYKGDFCSLCFFMDFSVESIGSRGSCSVNMSTGLTTFFVAACRSIYGGNTCYGFGFIDTFKMFTELSSCSVLYEVQLKGCRFGALSILKVWF